VISVSALPAPNWAKGAPISPSSAGPAYPEEARILWEDGQKAHQEGRHQDAVNALQRLVDRYPGYEGYLNAHLMLAKSRLELGTPKLAIAPLRYFIGASAVTNDSLQARLWLGRAYLETRQFHEAYLTSLEIQNQKNRDARVPGDMLSEALLIKGWALLGLGRVERATKTLDAAKASLTASSSPSVRGETPRLELELKLRGCRKLPTSKILDEAQIHNQLDRRGTCLLEALLLFHKIIEAGDPKAAKLGEDQLRTGFRSFADLCAKPPMPPAIAPKNRTAKQLKQYRAELAYALQQECQKKYASALDLLTGWKESAPAPTSEALNQLSLEIQKVKMR